MGKHLNMLLFPSPAGLQGMFKCLLDPSPTCMLEHVGWEINYYYKDGGHLNMPPYPLGHQGDVCKWLPVFLHLRNLHTGCLKSSIYAILLY